ncbi:MAG: hypothetical protein GXO89_12320 [Chlorobi bacterium]|nr:hypothetical protein [Chlorobiota bacterium]
MIFFSLSGLIVLLHALSPHCSNNTPFAGNHHLLDHRCSHSGKLPVHCHLSNNSAIDQTEGQIKKDPVPETSQDVVVLNDSGLQAVGNRSEIIKLPSKSDCFTTSVFLKNVPTRGSPLVV